jgi:hypothetical protein
MSAGTPALHARQRPPVLDARHPPAPAVQDTPTKPAVQTRQPQEHQRPPAVQDMESGSSSSRG